MVPEACAAPLVNMSRQSKAASLASAPSCSTSISEHLSAEQLAAAPHRFFCPITLDIMADPVLLHQTGQIYDYPSLLSWFESGGRNCPLTGIPLAGKVTLRVDTELRSEIMAWLRQQGVDADAVRAAVLLHKHNTDDHGSGKSESFAHKGQNKHLQRLRAALSAVASFLSKGTKFYGDIY